MLAIARCEHEEERASPVFPLILEEHKNILSPRRLCVCLRNTSLKLVMNSADPNAGENAFLLQTLIRNSLRSHVLGSSATIDTCLPGQRNVFCDWSSALLIRDELQQQ